MSEKYPDEKNNKLPSEGDARAYSPKEELTVQQPDDALPSITATDLPEGLRTALERCGWKDLMPVQGLALPYLLAGRDIMVQSRTGSGKTGCYLLPMLQSIDPQKKVPQALVLVPTRELALQVEREAGTIFAETGISACALYGGVGYKKQFEALKNGCQVVIGTPGRILDHLLKRSLDLSQLKSLVFDEADRMLSIGFYPDMLEISRYLPKKRQTSLFSATYPPHVLDLAAEFMVRPDMLSLSRKEVHVAEVEHRFCQVKPMDKDRALVRFLETENPASAIIFCNTKANVHYLCQVLQGFGYNADELSSDLSQKRREAVLGKVRDGTLQYLVATDVAARGIDIASLSHVFLYEPPEDQESYIHRAGRTGRAGSAGTVISLVDIMERMELERIARNYGITLVELPLPTDEDVANACSTRLMAFLEARQRKLTGLERIRQSRFVELARQLGTDEDETGNALMAMLLDDAYRQSRQSRLLPQGQAKNVESSGRGRGKRNAKRKSPRGNTQGRTNTGGGNAESGRDL